MSYSMISVVLLVVVALSAAISSPSSNHNVLARFYPQFAQLYRLAMVKPAPSSVAREDSFERYQFSFNVKEYSQISEESITMLYTNVTERTITYHPMPSFEVVGSRYLYRLNSQGAPFEVELVNPDAKLFREVQKPNRYFYITSLDDIQFVFQPPVMPFYEITFTCNSTFPKDEQRQLPILSYLDRSFQWRPRYLLDLPMLGNNSKSVMSAYADIYNNGDQVVVVKAVEFLTRNVRDRATNTPRSFDGSTSETFIYQFPTSTAVVIPARSIKSVKFVETDVKVIPFCYYTLDFSILNSTGNLLTAYNLTSHNKFLPAGNLLLRDEGRFIGERALPDLTSGQTLTMVFDHDADVTYRRRVMVAEQNNDTITFNVQYVFKNSKPSRDVRLYFVESFGPSKDYQITNISTSNSNQNSPDLLFTGSDLRGNMTIPRQRQPFLLSYQIAVQKDKTDVNNKDDN